MDPATADDSWRTVGFLRCLPQNAKIRIPMGANVESIWHPGADLPTLPAPHIEVSLPLQQLVLEVRDSRPLCVPLIAHVKLRSLQYQPIHPPLPTTLEIIMDRGLPGQRLRHGACLL